MSEDFKYSPEDALQDETRDLKEDRIKKVASEAKFQINDTSYSVILKKLIEAFKDYRAELEKYIKGKTVIDIGFGGNGTGIEIASGFEANKYIGVDLGDLDISSFPKEHRSTKLEYVIGKEGDMLTYLSNRENNSANIFINGIDRVIIDPKLEENQKYLQALAIEISRVVGNDHATFVSFSDVVEAELSKLGMQVYVFSEEMQIEIFSQTQIKMFTNNEEK